MGSLHGILAFFWKVIDAIIACVLVVMIVLVFTNAALRYGSQALGSICGLFGYDVAFQGSLAGAQEQSQYLFVWLVMLSAVVCVRFEEHLGLPLFVEKCPPSIQRFFGILKNATICLTGVMLCIGGYLQGVDNWNNILPLGGIPVGVLYFSGAVAGFLTAIIGAVRIFYPTFDNPTLNTEESHP